MAENKYKSQADKVVASGKGKAKAKKTTPAKQKETKGNKVSVNTVPPERKIPVRVISSIVFTQKKVISMPKMLSISYKTCFNNNRLIRWPE